MGFIFQNCKSSQNATVQKASNIPITAIYSPINGQSNAGGGWKNFIGDKESGASCLEDSIKSVTELPVVSLLKGTNGKFIISSTGGSTVDNITTSQGDDKVWWYIDENRPGGALLHSVKIMKAQYADMVTKYGEGVVIKMPWSQGESNASYLARKKGAKRGKIVERYKEGTKKVFAYMEKELGVPIDFFLIKARPIDEDGAVARGFSPHKIADYQEAFRIIRLAQDELIAEMDNVHFGADPLNLATARDWNPEKKKDDIYHYHPETYEVLGRECASSILKQMGF